MSSWRLLLTVLCAFLVAAMKPATTTTTEADEEQLPKDVRLRLGSTRFASGSAAEAATYSPDGQRIATANNADVRIWDARTGKGLGKIAVRNHSAEAIAFLDKDHVIVGWWNDGVVCHELSTGRQE